MKKLSTVLVLSLMLSSFFALTAFAGAWLTAKDGWWYRYDDGSYPTSQWVWLDGDNDGVSECYYFNQWGYLITDTHSPDGYYVDANGAWVDSGRVQTRGQKKQVSRFRQNWVYGEYEIHSNGIDAQMEVGWYSGTGEDYISLEGSNSVPPYHTGTFVGIVKYKKGNQYIAYGDHGDYVKFTYNGDSIVITDNSRIYESGSGFFGFMGSYNKVRDLSENVS